MGSAASAVGAVGAAPEAELQRHALQLSDAERERLLEAVRQAEKLKEQEIPEQGEQVLQLWAGSPFYTPRDLVQLDGKQWLPVRFDKVNPDGTYSLKHHGPAVPPENVKRYPPGMRPPEIAGITLGQLRKLYQDHQDWLETAKWNPHARKMQVPTMYDVVPSIVKPATAATKGSYVELFTQKAVDVFVSHWWGHEFSHFVRALEHAAAELVTRELKDREIASLVFWICSFANAQWTVNLGASLEMSPFERALASHNCKAVVMVMDEQAMPLTRIWCIYEVLRTSVLRLPFYVATKDGVLLGERVQEKRELAPTLLALAEKLLELQPTQALASNEEDKRMIVDAVSSAVGVPQFALAVQSSLFEVLRKAGYALFSKHWALNFRLLQVHRNACREVYWLWDPKKVRSYRRRDRPPEKRSGFHRAAQEGDRETLLQLLKEEDLKLNLIKDLKAQENNLRGVVDSYQKRQEIRCQTEEVFDQLAVHIDELGQEAIHLAARYSDPETVQTLVHMGRDPLHQRDFLGRLPLHRAAESGNPVMVAAMVSYYEPQEIVKELDKKQHSALDLAVLSGSVEAVRALQLDASSMETSSEKKRSPMHLAAQWNHVQVLEALRSLGFAVDAVDACDTQALHLAARFGHGAAVQRLVGLGAAVTATTSFGRTALHWAALNGHVQVTEALIESRCPVDQRDKAGWTAFHWTLRRKHAPCSRALMEGSADLMLEDLKSQRNSLHVAACFDVDLKLLEDLFEQLTALNLDTRDVAGKTPLHLSAQWGTVDVAVKLIELKSSIESRCSHQRTALYLSARRGNALVAYELLRRGADVAAADANGVQPIFVAARHDHFRVVMLLLQHHASVTSTEKDGMTVLHWAAKHGNCQALRALVAKSPSSADDLVAAVTRHGRTPLHVACLAGKVEAVKVLLQLRSDPTVRQKDGWMPIHLAARFGHIHVVEAMLEARCDGEARGVYGKTVAHCAVQHVGFFQAIACANPRKPTVDCFQQDQGGRNLWHIAALTGQQRYFGNSFMVRKNQNRKHIVALSTVDATGRTPVHLAAAKGQHLVVKEILETLMDDKHVAYDPRWDKKEHYMNAPDIEDLLNEEPPECPLLMLDHQRRLPLHWAASGGFAQVTTLLARFMLQKMDCTVSQLQAPDAHGSSPLKLALEKKHWEVVRRLCDILSLPEPLELREMDAFSVRDMPPWTKVRVREDFAIDSGKMLRKGEEGAIESCDVEESSVTIQFVGERVIQTFSQFASCCVVEKSYLLNGSTWHRRAKKPFPALHSRRQLESPAAPLPLDDCADSGGEFSEGDVARGFDEGRGWLRLRNGAYLPLLLQLDETRVVPALTPWQGPAIRRGQLVRTCEEMVKGRTIVLPHTVGLVRRIDDKDAAVVDFEGTDRWLRLPGKSFEELQVLPYVSVMEEPREVPEVGRVVLSSKRKECGQVHILPGPGKYSAVLFQVVFPDGTKSITLSDRRGLREIGAAPSVAQLASFVRRKEML